MGECGHQPVGDPDAMGRLRQVVDRLGAALAVGEEEVASVAAAAAERLASELARDPGPRTRAQARGVLLAVELVRRGERTEAVELLEGELRRSFPGEAELDGATEGGGGSPR
jgi:hypothetical protein